MFITDALGTGGDRHDRIPNATGPALTGVIDQGRGSKVGCWCEAVTKWGVPVRRVERAHFSRAHGHGAPLGPAWGPQTVHTA